MIIIKLLPILFAAACFLAAFWQMRKRKGRIRQPVYTEAVVISKVTQTEYRHRSLVGQSAPVVRYTTENGEKSAAYRFFVPDWQYDYHTGDKVEICYEKENPGIFQICRERSNVWKCHLLLCVGTVTLLAYAVLWLQYK